MLKFLHIPRTGGTSIEDIAIKHNIKWGRFDSWYQQNSIHRYSCVYGNSRFLPPWHHKFDLSRLNNNIFFCVIRNPIDRFISCYYMPFPQKDGIQNKTTETKNQFNKNISYLADKIKDNYIGQYGHQHNYIEFKHLDKIHILCFDRLVEDSNRLFQKYHLPIKLTNSTKSAPSPYRYRVKDLTKQNRDKLDFIFRKDYDLYINVKMNTLEKQCNE